MRALLKTQKQYWTNLGYSDEEASELVRKCQRERSPRCPEYWLKRGHSPEEAVSKVSEYQRGTAKKLLEKYTPEERKVFSPSCIEFWTKKGYSVEEAIQTISSNSAKAWSVDHLKEKYGEDEGTRLYNERSEKRKTEYTLSGYIKKHGVEKGTEMWNRKFSTRPNSKAAEQFLKPIVDYLDGYKVYCSLTSLGEYGINDTSTNRYYYYDLVVPELKFCVEFNGSYWHGDPKIYEDEHYFPRSNKTAKEIREYDTAKINAMTELRGFAVHVVWESDDLEAMTNQLIGVIDDLKKH